MKLHHTDAVTADAERPARRDGTCFYCREPIGGLHKPDCVLVEKTVVLRMTMDVVVRVPDHWSREDIRFFYNDGSWCANNMLRALGKWEDANKDGDRICACGAATFEVINDATEDDHARMPMIGKVRK